MARDYGGADPPRWRKGERLAYARGVGGKVFLGVALLLIASLPIAMPASLDQTVIWGHRKPPKPTACPTITPADFDRGWKEDARTFTFSGVTFARRRGDVDCLASKHGLFGVMGAIYPVCRFNAPFALKVSNSGGTRYFAVPGGYTAEVAAAPDDIRCKVLRRHDIYALEE
jgi:hypothetical protein